MAVSLLSGATLSGADAGNYTLDSVATSKANITPKAITVKADDKTKVYGSADPVLTVVVRAGALEQGDSLSGSLVRAPGNDIGSYAITTGSLSAGSNYDLTVSPGTLTITKKAIMVQADDKSKVYGWADPDLTVSVPTGALEQGDSLSGSLERASGKNVGSYAITRGSLTAGSNYDLTVTPGTFAITPKPITVTADPRTKVIGATDPELTSRSHPAHWNQGTASLELSRRRQARRSAHTRSARARSRSEGTTTSRSSARA